MKEKLKLIYSKAPFRDSTNSKAKVAANKKASSKPPGKVVKMVVVVVVEMIWKVKMVVKLVWKVIILLGEKVDQGDHTIG